MKRVASFSLALALLASSPARAQEAPVAEAPVAAAASAGDARFELAARGLFATPPVSGGVTPLGLGAGGAFGVVASHVFVGANLAYFAGGADDSGNSEHALLYGLELGYDVPIGPALTLRPIVGGGGASIAHVTPATASSTGRTPRGSAFGDGTAVDVVTQATSISSGGGSTGSSSSTTTVDTWYVAPGLMAYVGERTGAYFGTGARVLYFPKVDYGGGAAASWLSYSLCAELGVRF